MRSVSWVIRASLALWGLALAIASMPRLALRARDGELPGALQHEGLASSTPMLQFALILVLPFLIALAGQRVVPLLAERKWAAWTFAGILALAPVTLMHYGTFRHVVLHGIAAFAIVFARKLEPRFSRSDALLFPCVLNFYFAFLDTGFGRTPAATFFRAAMALLALRLLVGHLSKSRRPAIAFAFAPLAFLFQMHLLDRSVAGPLALLWLIGTPLLLVRVDPRKLLRLAAWTVFPIAAAAYPLALIGANSRPVVDFFEDGHSLLPASEMARGELPYRDIIPMHGLLTDGGLDLAAMQLIRPDLGAVLGTRRILAALTATAIYFTALAVTSSAELALLTTFLSLAIFPAASLWHRVVVPLLALACAAAATRLRAKRWFLACGVLLVLSTLLSLDLAVCSGVIAFIAAIRARALVPLLKGIVFAAVPLLILFALLGFLSSFITTTFGEVLGQSGVYAIGQLDLPHGLRTLAEMAAAISHPELFALMMWFVALIGASAVLAKSPLKMHRGDAVWLVAGWLVLAGATYVLRRHFYFAFALAPFLAGALLAVRRRSRTVAVVLTAILILYAKPFALVFDISSPLRRSGGLDVKEWSEYTAAPRARGAVVDPLTHKALGSTQKFLATHLRPNETFYDFANAGALYFIFDRPCPIRELEVPAYERENAQRNVIATLQRDRSIRAALIAFPTAYTTIDGIPNNMRAPLVWAYLQKHFRPAMNENGVEMWVRADVGVGR
jgi:hypothetical protein